VLEKEITYRYDVSSVAGGVGYSDVDIFCFLNFASMFIAQPLVWGADISANSEINDKHFLGWSVNDTWSEGRKMFRC